MRAWMHATLTGLAAAGYELAGFGAAAKGMVLLHYLLAVPGRSWELAFVIDESPFKQGTFCPGTSTPVLPAAALASRNASRPLALIVLAWNFADEILRKIAVRLREARVETVLAVIPFPRSRLVRMDVASGALTELLQNSQTLAPWPRASHAPTTFAVLLMNNVRGNCWPFLRVFLSLHSSNPLLCPRRAPLFCRTGFGTMRTCLTACASWTSAARMAPLASSRRLLLAIGSCTLQSREFQ